MSISNFTCKSCSKYLCFYVSEIDKLTHNILRCFAIDIRLNDLPKSLMFEYEVIRITLVFICKDVCLCKIFFFYKHFKYKTHINQKFLYFWILKKNCFNIKKKACSFLYIFRIATSLSNQYSCTNVMCVPKVTLGAISCHRHLPPFWSKVPSLRGTACLREYRSHWRDSSECWRSGGLYPGGSHWNL